MKKEIKSNSCADNFNYKPVINSKDTKKREIKLAKEEYINMARFVDRELDDQIGYNLVFKFGVGTMLFTSGALLTLSIANSDINNYVEFAISCLCTLYSGKKILEYRKDIKEDIKALKEAKKTYKNMYKKRLIEIKENYLLNRALEENTQKKLIK